MFRKVLLTLAVVLVQAGCSWIFTEGPPANHPTKPYFNCSSSYAPPVLDTVWGGLNLLEMMAALDSQRNQSTTRDTSQGRIIALGLTWAAVATASAYYGYTRVPECRRAQEALQLRLLYVAPNPSSPPQPPPPGSTPPP